jgi:hypothetical protein
VSQVEGFLVEFRQKLPGFVSCQIAHWLTPS